MHKILLTILLSALMAGDSVVRADAGGAIIGGAIGGVAGGILGGALASHDRHHRDHNRTESRKRKHIEVVQVDEQEDPGQGIGEDPEVEVVYVRQPRRVVRRVYYDEPSVTYHVGYAPCCPPMYTHVAYHHPVYVHESYTCHDDCSCSPAPIVGGLFGAFTGAMIGGLAFGD